MKILFLSLSRFNDIKVRGIYSDLMRELISRGCKLYIASPTERRFRKPTHLVEEPNCKILKVKTLNIQKTNIIEKGIGTLLLEYQFAAAIRKYWRNIHFDLILYATPPITFNKIINNLKKRCKARTYLMLKDIFPQNAVDLGMMKNGSVLHKMFRLKERKLYALSDKIGCMSPANCKYVIEHNSEIDASKIELCPNAIEVIKQSELSDNERDSLIEKIGIPNGKTLFIYGGNLGKPQGIDFLLQVISENERSSNSYIIIVGSGTEYSKVKLWFEVNTPHNAKLLAALPKDKYDKLIKICDVGLIFLDPRFTIPNYPSRLLSYMENKMPVLIASDSTTDMGQIAESAGFGLWSLSGDIQSYMKHFYGLANNAALRKDMGLKAFSFLQANYTIDKVADIILNSEK